MVSRWLLRVAIASAVVGTVTMTGASVAWADPPGNNGTVKINSQGVDSNDDISNRPHVPCNFQVEFFGFDRGQTARITFTIHPPSGRGGVLRSETRTVSNDRAGGGRNDVDMVFKYSGTSFGLDRYTRHPKQGYHVKLTVVSAGIPGGKKHKVFWLKCAAAAPPPVTTPPVTPPPGATTPPGQLPVTGAGLTGLVAAGVVLVGGGTALLIFHRRRTAIESMADL